MRWHLSSLRPEASVAVLWPVKSRIKIMSMRLSYLLARIHIPFQALHFLLLVTFTLPS